MGDAIGEMRKIVSHADHDLGLRHHPARLAGRIGGGGRGGRQASEQALLGLDRRHARPPEVRRADHVIPQLDISVPFDWNATSAEVTERVRAAMDD